MSVRRWGVPFCFLVCGALCSLSKIRGKFRRLIYPATWCFNLFITPSELLSRRVHTIMMQSVLERSTELPLSSPTALTAIIPPTTSDGTSTSLSGHEAPPSTLTLNVDFTAETKYIAESPTMASSATKIQPELCTQNSKRTAPYHHESSNDVCWSQVIVFLCKCIYYIP
jgi:hypothetical protein